MSQSLEMRVLA